MVEHKYKVQKKGLNVVVEEQKQRMQAKATKIKRYDQRIEKYRTNRFFQQDQKRVYQQPNGKIESSENLTQKKVGDYGVSFGKQGRVTTTMLNG